MGWGSRRLNGGLAAAVLITVGLAASAPTVPAAEVVLKDGRILTSPRPPLWERSAPSN